jgi:fumarate reductase subunit C
MDSSQNVIAGVGLADRPRKSRWPARMDLAQSLSGLVLGLFMWGHMFFVSSILLGKDAMWSITKLFEGYFFFGTAYPGMVSVIVAGIFVLIIVHAFLAMRKFPANYQQYRTFIGHRKLMAHEDTTLWWVQAITGFMLFFLAAVHLYQMMMHPGDIGPYESADRVWSGRWWPLYLVALFAVELHGGIGLYRLCVKWGWLEGKDPNASRKRLKVLKWALTVFFVVLGLATLGAYMKIGYEHRDRVGERYAPAWVTPNPMEKAK